MLVFWFWLFNYLPVNSLMGTVFKFRFSKLYPHIKRVSIIHCSFVSKQLHWYLNNTIVVRLRFAIPDCCNIFHTCSQAQEALRILTAWICTACSLSKKECCTWLYAFLPVSRRVWFQGEKLCRIICKSDKQANQETVALSTYMNVQLLLIWMLINTVKKQFWRGLFFHCTQNLYAHYTNSLKLWCKPIKCIGPEMKVYWKIEVGGDLANISWEVSIKTLGKIEMRLGRWLGNVKKKKKSHIPPSFFNFYSAWPFWSRGKPIWSTSSILLLFLKPSFHFFPS